MRGKALLKDWQFTLEEVAGPHLPETDDSSWRTLDIPHDWSVEFPLNHKEGHPCTGFRLGGLGWYRKHFITTEEMTDTRVILHFDGIYCRSHIYCNGELVTFHPYGYSPVLVDVTDYLNETGQDNVIAVSVDHRRHHDSRWYTGSGIYRKVAMHILPKVHIPVWGLYVRTPEITKEEALVTGQVTLNNGEITDQTIKVVSTIFNEGDKKVASTSQEVTVKAGSSLKVDLSSTITNPELWEMLAPYHYTYDVQLYIDDVIVHEDTTRFGVRSFEFDAEKGFFFNGKNTLIKGVCLHHDGGLVGSAVPKDVWRRRLEVLIEGGCNAIRTAHNPMDEDFMDLCDELGLLVQEEFFDEWDNPKDKRLNGVEKSVDFLSRAYTEYFRDYAKMDLQNVVLRDRNHPGIIQWSIGNEIEWTYSKYNSTSGYFGMSASGNYFWDLPPHDLETIKEKSKEIPRELYDIGSTAAKLSKWTKELDDTRVVTANCILPTVSFESGYTDALDLVGFSYRRIIYDYAKKNYPGKPIMGTENLAQWHDWKAVLEHDHIPGIFLWTGIDHMGEAQTDGPETRKGTNVGIVDLAGFPKAPYHMMKALWSEAPYTKLYTQKMSKTSYELVNDCPVDPNEEAWQQRLWFWHDVNNHWNYDMEESVAVEVYSNCEEVSLYLNDVLLGTKFLKDFEDHIYKWHVPFVAGELKAVGKKASETSESRLTTSKSVDKIEVSADVHVIKADADSVAHVVTQFVDRNGNDVRVINETIIYSVDGPGKIIGVDNGHPDNIQDFQTDRLETSDGRSLMILKGLKPGKITVDVYCPAFNLESKTVTIVVE